MKTVVPIAKLARSAETDSVGAGGRPWTFVLAAVILVTVVVGGTAALVISPRTDTAAPHRAQPETTEEDRSDWGIPFLDGLGRRVEVPPDQNGVALPQDSTLQRDPSEDDYLRASPQGVMWQQVDGVPIPFSASDGPVDIDGEIPVGFARSPQGAALATLQLTARTFASKEGALAIASVRMVFADATARQKALDRYAAVVDWPTMGSDRIEAYKISYWSSDYAVVELAKAPLPGKVSLWETGRFELLWRDGDWHLKAGPVTGSVVPTGQIASLAGWTPWHGK